MGKASDRNLISPPESAIRRICLFLTNCSNMKPTSMRHFAGTMCFYMTLHDSAFKTIHLLMHLNLECEIALPFSNKPRKKRKRSLSQFEVTIRDHDHCRRCILKLDATPPQGREFFIEQKIERELERFGWIQIQTSSALKTRETCSNT